MRVGTQHGDSTDPRVRRQIMRTTDGRWMECIAFGNSGCLVYWSDRDGGHIVDIELGFGRWEGWSITDLMRVEDGQDYLEWLLRARFLHKDVLEFINLTMQDFEEEDLPEVDFRYR